MARTRRCTSPETVMPTTRGHAPASVSSGRRQDSDPSFPTAGSTDVRLGRRTPTLNAKQMHAWMSWVLTITHGCIGRWVRHNYLILAIAVVGVASSRPPEGFSQAKPAARAAMARSRLDSRCDSTSHGAPCSRGFAPGSTQTLPEVRGLDWPTRSVGRRRRCQRSQHADLGRGPSSPFWSANLDVLSLRSSRCWANP